MENQKNVVDLYSNNKEVNTILSKLKSNTKVYSRLISALQFLGNFPKKINTELFDIIEEGKKILLCCSDINNNMFLFYGMSSNKKDQLLIAKITNIDEKKYDISLAKKFPLNKDNIDFTRADKEYGFKFGRLITDDKNFYSLFLSNNVGYQIQIDFNINVSHKLLKYLNQLENQPSLLEYTSIFEKILQEENIDSFQGTIMAYKDFLRLTFIDLNNTIYNHKKTLTKRI